MSKPGTTTLRMTGGVITAACSTPVSTAGAAANQQQACLFLASILELSSCLIKPFFNQTAGALKIAFKCCLSQNIVSLNRFKEQRF